MKTYEIRVTQNLTGYYQGYLEIEAPNKKEANKILKSMSKEEIDNCVSWEHGDEYDGDVDSIRFEGTLHEI